MIILVAEGITFDDLDNIILLQVFVWFTEDQVIRVLFEGYLIQNMSQRSILHYQEQES